MPPRTGRAWLGGPTGVRVRPPVEPMHAVAVDGLPAADSCRGGCAYGPKWGGRRALLFVAPAGAYLQSRAGRPLGSYFPDLTRLASHLPAGAVVDGELVIWDSARGRTSFALLHRRITAGKTLVSETLAHPAHLI